MSNVWTRKYKIKTVPQNSEEIVDCAPCRGEPCLKQNSEAMLKVYNRRMYNYVRVPSSLYMGTLGGLNTFNQSRGGVFGLRWNQSSDKRLPHVGKAIVPSHGNSTRSSITRHRPGAGAPGGTGVDIKHNSYDRHLAKLKAKNLRPRESTHNPTPKQGNKMNNISIFNYYPNSRCNLPLPNHNTYCKN